MKLSWHCKIAFLGFLVFPWSHLPAQGAQAPPARETSLDKLKLLQVLPLAARLYHVQGMDLDGTRLWVTSVDRESRKGFLHLLDLPSGTLRKEVEVQDGECFHPGGICLDGSSVWVPVAEYRRESRSLIQKRDRDTLSLVFSFPVEDHIGAVAAASDRLIGGNWDSRLLYFWSPSGKLLSRQPNPGATAYQDMKINGRSLLASGNRKEGGGTIDWLDIESLSLLRTIRAGKTDRGVPFTNEGVALYQGRLYLLPEDGPSRLFIFQLPQ